MKLFKLTDPDGFTQGPTQWGDGVKHTIASEKRSKKLCSPGVLHAYKNINLALLLNPNHANIFSPIIWEANGKIVTEDLGKVGCWELTTVKRIDAPGWYETHRQDVQVMFAILCAESVLCHFEKYRPTDDRPRKAIEAARKYLKSKTADAARAAVNAANAAYAASDAARAADAAAYAAYAAVNSAYAAVNSARAADAAAYAADAAAYSAYAADAAGRIDFGKLADLAVKQIIEVM